MTDRLSAQDWIDFALAALARDGAEALKADVLARRLGVSRGSFYWHFSDLAALHARVIAHWSEMTTERTIGVLEQQASPQARLDWLLRRSFAHDAVLEVRMRAWADSNAAAARAIAAIDRRRRGYIERILADAGIAPELATTRAQLLYWAYLGSALNRTRLSRTALERTVAELMRIGFGGSEDAAAPARRCRRRPRA